MKKRKGGERIIKKRNEFRNAMAKAAFAVLGETLNNEQKGDLIRAIQAYGAEGDSNGVIVAEGKVKDNAAAETTSVGEYGFTADPQTGAVTPNIKVTFRQGQTIQPGAVAHEGSHVADRLYLVAGLTPLMSTEDWVKSVRNIDRYTTEYRAYAVSSAVAQGRGEQTYNAGGYEIWNSGWRQADREVKRANGIHKLLRESKLYNVTPQNPGPRLIELKKQ